MSLTPAQLVAFKADLDTNTDPVIVQSLIAGTGVVTAEWYSGDASPDYWVWRSDVTRQEIKNVLNWTEYINVIPGGQGAFMLLIEDGSVDAGKANIRQGFNDIFSSAPISKVALIALAKRFSNRIEKLLATGGNGDEATPATLSYEGTIDRLDVAEALKL